MVEIVTDKGVAMKKLWYSKNCKIIPNKFGGHSQKLRPVFFINGPIGNGCKNIYSAYTGNGRVKKSSQTSTAEILMKEWHPDKIGFLHW